MANIELDGANKKIKVDSGDLTLDVPGDIILDADGADLTFADGGTNILKITNSSSDVVFQNQVDAKDIIFKQYDGTEVAKIDDDGSFKVANSTLSISQSSSDVIIKPLTDAKDIIFQQYDGTAVATVEDNGTFNIPASKLAIGGTAVTSTAAELNIMDGVTATAAELNIMDGVTATAAEINLIDGGTARGTTAIADGDGVLINDAGTMRMTNVTTLKTYIGGGISNADYWTKGADQAINAQTDTTITGSWGQQTGRGGGGDEIGSGLTESSGVFTFSETGIWYVTGWFRCVKNGDTRYINLGLQVTTDGSAYNVLGFGSGKLKSHGNDAVTQVDASAVIDCTDTTSIKFKFVVTADESISIGGDSNYSQSGVIAIKLGDT